MRVAASSGLHFVHDDVTLSVGIGPGHYCDARNGEKAPSNCEIAVWHKDEPMMDLGNDNVAGYIPLDHLPELLRILCNEPFAHRKIASYLIKLKY